MSALLIILALLFGRSHVYAGLNVGVTYQGCGFEIIGQPGPFCGIE